LTFLFVGEVLHAIDIGSSTAFILPGPNEHFEFSELWFCRQSRWWVFDKIEDWKKKSAYFLCPCHPAQETFWQVIWFIKCFLI